LVTNNIPVSVLILEKTVVILAVKDVEPGCFRSEGAVHISPGQAEGLKGQGDALGNGILPTKSPWKGSGKWLGHCPFRAQ